MPDPNKLIFVGALDVTDGESVALVIPPNADAETIRQAILLSCESMSQGSLPQRSAIRSSFAWDNLSSRSEIRMGSSPL